MNSFYVTMAQMIECVPEGLCKNTTFNTTFDKAECPMIQSLRHIWLTQQEGKYVKATKT